QRVSVAAGIGDPASPYATARRERTSGRRVPGISLQGDQSLPAIPRVTSVLPSGEEVPSRRSRGGLRIRTEGRFSCRSAGKRNQTDRQAEALLVTGQCG